MPHRKSSDPLRAQARRAKTAPAGSPPLTNAELVQLQVRVIALEAVIIALLAEATEPQIKRACERASYIVPRQGHTPHPLTINAAARVIGMTRDAARFRGLTEPARVAGGFEVAQPGRDETS